MLRIDLIELARDAILAVMLYVFVNCGCKQGTAGYFTSLREPFCTGEHFVGNGYRCLHDEHGITVVIPCQCGFLPQRLQ